MRVRRKFAAGAMALALGTPLLIQAVTSPAAADTTSVVTDRSVGTSVGWYWYTGVSEAFINNFNSANATRVVEVDVDNPTGSPHTFTVRLVKNGKSAVATAFCNAARWIAKGGSYSNANYPKTVYYSGGSLTSLPTKTTPGGAVTGYRDYAFTQWIHAFVMVNSSHETTVNNARSQLYYDAMRPQIRSAIATW